MVIVEFDDGTFGVRKTTIFGYRFLNLDMNHIWQRSGTPYFNQCRTHRKERAEEAILKFGIGIGQKPVI
jgi:hypothetical protein